MISADWVELDDASVSLQSARSMERRGLLIMAQRREPDRDVVVVKLPAHPPAKILEWRSKRDA